MEAVVQKSCAPPGWLTRISMVTFESFPARNSRGGELKAGSGVMLLARSTPSTTATSSRPIMPVQAPRFLPDQEVCRLGPPTGAALRASAYQES